MATQISRPDYSYLKLENGGYGYQFWTYLYELNNTPLYLAEAKGNGGQSVFICRQLNLVVVITAGSYRKIEGTMLPGKILHEYILPAVLMLHI